MVGMCATTIDCLAVCTMNTSAGQWATHRCLAFTACGDCKFKKLRRSLPHTQAVSSSLTVEAIIAMVCVRVLMA